MKKREGSPEQTLQGERKWHPQWRGLRGLVRLRFAQYKSTSPAPQQKQAAWEGVEEAPMRDQRGDRQGGQGTWVTVA